MKPGELFSRLRPRLYRLVCEKIRAQFHISEKDEITEAHLSNVNVNDENPFLAQIMLSELNRPCLTDRESEFAYVCPDETALQLLVKLGPLIEIGAGKGYWAQQITLRGGDIIACDNEPRAKTFHNVLNANHLLAAEHANRTLFLCYPDPGMLGTQASDALEAYTKAGGKTVAVVCNYSERGSGDEWFFKMLRDHKGHSKYYGTQSLAPFHWEWVKDHKLPEVQITKIAELRIYSRIEKTGL